MTRNEQNNQSVKIDWSRATEKDLWLYKASTNRGLSDIDIPSEAILCDNINCKNHKHSEQLCVMYDNIVNCLTNGGKILCNNRVNKQNVRHNSRPGWNEHS